MFIWVCRVEQEDCTAFYVLDVTYVMYSIVTLVRMPISLPIHDLDMPCSVLPLKAPLLH